MTQAEDQFSKHLPKDYISKLDLDQQGSWQTDETMAIIKLKSTLTDYQLQAFEFAEWMFYGPRATGRTYLFATLAICRALENPNTWIIVLDHYRMNPLADYLEDMLRNRIKELPMQATFEIMRRNGYLHIRYNIGYNRDLK